jgi:hypothetical protein
MRRLRVPAALTVTVVAPLAAAIPSCSGDDGPPDARSSPHADARAPDDGSAEPDGGIADAGTPDAAVPEDAAPDTPIT